MLCGVRLREREAILTGVSPRLLREVLDVEQLHLESVSRLSALDGDGSGQVVDLGEVNVADVVGIVRVLPCQAMLSVNNQVGPLALAKP